MNITLVGRGPWFTGLRSALSRALRGMGHAVIEREGMPPVLEGDLLFVIGIHDHGPPPPRGKTVTAGLLTEQPLSPHGERMDILSLYSAYDRIYDINPTRAAAKKFILFPAWTEWDHSPFQNAERPIRTMWYGSRTPRRAEILNSVLKKVELFEPPGFIASEEKRLSLLSAKATLLIHAYDGPSYEPFRIVEAASCGTLLVSERPAVTDGWVPGEDFISAETAKVPEALEDALADYHAFEPMRRKAHAKSAANSPRAVAQFLIETWRS